MTKSAMLVLFAHLGACSQLIFGPSALASGPQTIFDFGLLEDGYHLRLPQDGETGRLWRDYSHVGMTVSDCSTSNWRCYDAGVVAFLSPIICSELPQDKWTVSNVEAQVVITQGSTLYVATTSPFKQSLGGREMSGYVYSPDSGVTGIWFSDLDNPSGLSASDFRVVPLTNADSFLKCQPAP